MRQTPQSNASPAPLTLAFTDRWAAQPVFGVKRKTWRKDDEHAHLADKEFEPVREKVLKRDNNSCRFCTFKAAKYQEVHHVDDDHTNNHPDNLLTVCNLCHQVHHLGLAGMRGAGFMAPIPELTQTEVNSIVRCYFVAQLLGDQNSRDKLTGLYAAFRARADDLKAAAQVDISSPLEYARILSADDTIFKNRAHLLGPLRLVPTKEAFSEAQLQYYAVQLRPQFHPENWAALTRQLMG